MSHDLAFWISMGSIVVAWAAVVINLWSARRWHKASKDLDAASAVYGKALAELHGPGWTPAWNRTIDVGPIPPGAHVDFDVALAPDGRMFVRRRTKPVGRPPEPPFEEPTPFEEPKE